MTREYGPQAGSRPADQSPTRSFDSDSASPMLSASASNNHSLFSFGRSHGAGVVASHQSNNLLSSHDTADPDDVADHITNYDFLPSVSFDDLQSSLESASTEFKLAQFPTETSETGSALLDSQSILDSSQSILESQGLRESQAIRQSQKSILESQGLFDKMVEQSAGNSSFSGPRATASSRSSSRTRATGATIATASRIAVPSTASTPSVTSSSTRNSRTSSILRRPSLTSRSNGNTTGTAASTVSSSASSSANHDAPNAATAATRRRQSHYPPVSNSSIGKPPRKSVGPGVFDSEYATGVTRTTSRRRPSMASNSDRSVPSSARSSIDGGSRLSTGDSTSSRSINGTRASKARSFQNPTNRGSAASAGQEQNKPAPAIYRPPRATNNHNNAHGGTSNTNNLNFSHSTNSVPSGSHHGPYGPTAGRRLSMAPPVLPVPHSSHATGLGARTVSPTDARRMKRMSIMPPAVPTYNVVTSHSTGSIPTGTSSTNNTGNTINGTGSSSSRDATQTINIPIPSSADARASSRSPSMLPRKTSTPSSSRTTPDPNRKSYSSGLSVSSSAMSFNTVRTSFGPSTNQPRFTQTSGTGSSLGSRLPAPKSTNTHSHTPLPNDDDEDVPPVPAIPKAYESPKDSPAELSFLEKRRSNLAFDNSSTHSSSTGSLSFNPTALDPPAKIHRKNSVRSGSKDAADKGNHTTNSIPMPGNSKKNLQPLQLPPINLQPLNSSTATKIAALHEQGASDRNLSPPPSRVIAKTPTTPMTASRSTFARHYHDDRGDLTGPIMRSMSSTHHARLSSPTHGDPLIPSEDVSGMASKMSLFPKPSLSPYLSTSAPKSSPMEPPAYSKGSKTGSGDGADDFVLPKPSVTPAPPPIPVASTPLHHKPSGPRAPAPTPSRALAAAEASGIFATSADTSVFDPADLTSRSIAAATPKSPQPLSSPDEPTTPSSIGSSLRRKLSLSWKRSNSKSNLNGQSGSNGGDKTPGASTTDLQQQQQQQQQQHQHSHNFLHHQRQQSSNPKYDGMPPPPPRIPVSSMKASPTPAVSTQTAEAQLDPRRRKTSASSLNAVLAQDKARAEAYKGDRSHKKDVPAVPATSDHRPSTSSGISHRVIKPKSSASGVRHDAWTVDLDKDDLTAEDEMKKLGSRRKETELAARTLDALRKRATPKERVSPQEAIRIAMLNIYERGEIVDYNDIYFCGTQNAAKVVGDLHTDKPNFGYDDERGDYTIVPGDHLSYRYEIIDLLGKGSFGQVVRCIDHKTGVLVAVKIIRNKKRFHQQALVEVNILQKLREWDPKNKHSMVNFTHSFYFRGHLCISTELLDMNLYEFIKANSFRGFSLKLIRRFTKQLLSSLMLLKQHKVIHCDLKPENILLRHPLHSEIKVIDFGSSCFENEKVYTYIQSRFYRSPEVILGMTYGMPIDMWSLGCILAELFTGVPIFPGENEQEQLACIMEVFGPPEKHLIEKSTRKKLFFDSNGKPRLTVSSKGRRRRPSSKTLQQAIKCDDEAFLDFLARCLRWDPDRRLKPEEAIRHEFITGQKAPPPTAVPSRTARDGSPIRRHNTVSGGPRPLPEPPGGNAVFKLGVPPTLRTGHRDSSGLSPHKTVSTGSASRRTSAVSSSTVAGNKRVSGVNGSVGIPSVNGSASGSGLPRAAGRVVSAGGAGKDIAAAGAAAAMTRRA